MNIDPYSNLKVAIRAMVVIGIILILILLAENLLEPDGWSRVTFFVVNLLILAVWMVVEWPPHMWSYRRKLRRYSRGYLWGLMLLVFLLFLVLVYDRIPLFSPRGAWIELALLAVMYSTFNMGVDYYLARYVDKLEQTNNPLKK